MVTATAKKKKPAPQKRAARKVKASVAQSPDEGTLVPGRVYTIEAAALRIGQGEKAIREMFHQGLKRTKRGRRVYIKSDDLIEFMLNGPEVE